MVYSHVCARRIPTCACAQLSENKEALGLGLPATAKLGEMLCLQYTHAHFKSFIHSFICHTHSHMHALAYVHTQAHVHRHARSLTHTYIVTCAQTHIQPEGGRLWDLTSELSPSLPALSDTDSASSAVLRGPLPKLGGVPRIATPASTWLSPDPSAQIAGTVLSFGPICDNPFSEQAWGGVSHHSVCHFAMEWLLSLCSLSGH